MFEDATFESDYRSDSLLAMATAAQHTAIQSVVEQMDSPPEDPRSTVVYRFLWAEPWAAREVLEELLEDARFAVDDRTRTMAATATAEQHVRIQEVVQQMDKPTKSGRSTRVYRLTSASASRVASAFDDMIRDGQVAVDPDSNTLVVTAYETDHLRVQEAVEALNADDQLTMSTKVYPLKRADPNRVRDALLPLVPQARITSDPASGTVIVSGSEIDQTKVSQVVSKLDTASGQEAIVRAYPIQYADAKSVHQSLAATFQGNGSFSISFQEPTRTLFLVATPKNHEVFERLVSQLDKPSLAPSAKLAKALPLSQCFRQRRAGGRGGHAAGPTAARTGRIGSGGQCLDCGCDLTAARKNRGDVVAAPRSGIPSGSV